VFTKCFSFFYKMSNKYRPRTFLSANCNDWLLLVHSLVTPSNSLVVIALLLDCWFILFVTPAFRAPTPPWYRLVEMTDVFVWDKRPSFYYVLRLIGLQLKRNIYLKVIVIIIIINNKFYNVWTIMMIYSSSVVIKSFLFGVVILLCLYVTEWFTICVFGVAN